MHRRLSAPYSGPCLARSSLYPTHAHEHTSPTPASTVPAPPKSPRLLDRLRRTCRLRHFSQRTEEAYCYWTRRFIVHHQMRHQETLGAADVAAFLTALAETEHVSASTQNQALCALVFLYTHVLQRPLDHAIVVRSWFWAAITHRRRLTTFDIGRVGFAGAGTAP